MSEFKRERRRMVKSQIEARGLRNERLLAAFESVPRHKFVPEEYRYAAYDDSPLPIDLSQTISQPYIVALMTDLLNLDGHERVLEIGTGSGYQAAILSMMAKEVHTIEFLPELATKADRLLKKLGFDNVDVHIGDGTLGWPDSAPYEGILVAAAAPKTPKPLLDQLDEGARLVLPVGGRGVQNLEVWEKTGGEFATRIETAVSFVPLRGDQGWARKDW